MTRWHHLADAPLPSFRRPPVVEVVIGAQLLNAAQFSLESLGAFAAQLGEEGLTVQQSASAVPVRHELTDPKAQAMGPSLEVLLDSGPPRVRHLLHNTRGDEMVQIQPDWLAVNWRKASADDDYPRWPRCWETFKRRAQLAERCFGEGTLRYGRAEVTYVNHIERDDTLMPHSQAHRVFSFLTPGGTGEGLLPEPEQSEARLTFVLGGDPEVAPFGRMDVTVSPVWSADDMRPILTMTLTVRGDTAEHTLDGVHEFAVQAREWIVRSFADLTTPAMHIRWEREDQKEDSE